MALVLTEEQQMLKNSAKEFFNGNSPVSSLRHLRDTNDELGFDKRVWEEMVNMGWAGLVFPEAYGGLSFDYTGLGQVFYESGKTLAASPLVSTVALAGSILNDFGSDEIKEKYLTTLCAGDKLFAVAFEEKSKHDPLHAMTSVADNTLTGSKNFVLDGHCADYIIVTATSDKGLGVYLVDAHSESVSIDRHIMMDSRNAASVSFKNAPVIDIIGSAGEGGDVITDSLDKARILLSAEMLGSLEEAFERTVNYLKERRQFNVPIGSFQGLQHRAADMFCEIELCKSMVIKSLQAIDAGDEKLAQLASATKAKVSQIAQLVSNEAIQMFGGIGMTDDEEIGFFLKRARVAQQTFGDYNYHLDRYARLKNF